MGLKRVFMFATVVMGALVSSIASVPEAKGQCPNSQQLAQLRQQRDEFSRWAQNHCGDPRFRDACSNIRTFIDQANRTLAACQNNGGGGNSSNNCESQRRQMIANSERSRNQALGLLQRTRPGRFGQYVITYRLSRTTHCHQPISYTEPRVTRVNAAEAQRFIMRTTNNFGLVDMIRPF